MVKIVVLYGPPLDPAAFDEYYAEQYRPVAARCPHVRLLEPARVVNVLEGTEWPYYRIDEMWFHDLRQAYASVESPEGQAWRAEFPKFATGGVTMLIADTETD